MELAENKDLLQTVFDSATNGIAIMSSIYNTQGKVEDLSVLMLNAYTLKLIGATAYKGKKYSEVFPMIKEAGILDKFLAVAETGNAANFEGQYAVDGVNNWFHFTAVKQGELLIVTTEDITERKQTEMVVSEALETTEKQKSLYDSIINNIPDLVYAFDLEYRFTYANEALLAMWGKSASESIGKGLRENGYEEWHALMHEREIDTVAATKKPIRGTVSFPHATLGSRYYDYIMAPVFNEAGIVIAIAGSTRDITEIKQIESSLQRSEARFRNMIEQAPIAILLTKGEDVIIESVNKPMLRFMNKTTTDEVLGKKMLTVLPELAGQPALQTVINVQRTGVSFRGDEQPVDLLINGKLERRYFNFSYDLIEESAESSAVLHMAIDVTEQVATRKRIEESEARYRILSETLEQQVNERTKELQRSNEDLQQFAHVASHDLKEPVRKIKTFTDRLERNLAGRLDADGSSYIERINIATDRMFTMIDGVLVYSTTNASRQEREMVDLNVVLQSIETDLEVTLQATGGKIKSRSLPILEGAPVLLYQLFYNLINNSIKFVAPGTAPRITLTSDERLVQGRNFACITLQDNGIGFENTYAERIFDTFTRLNSKDKYEGTGLGLALCKKITERHGGSIVASGNPGIGATFTIMLPMQQKLEDI